MRLKLGWGSAAKADAAAAASSRYDRIILHIGMNKTGSTSIQNALDGFDDGSSLYVPFAFHNHSIPLYTIFAADYLRYHIWKDRGLRAEQIEQLRAEQQAILTAALERRDRRTLIMSGEDISLIDPAGVARLIASLRPHAETVEAICYVRSPLSFAASAFQQRCQGGLGRVPKSVDPLYRQRIEKFIDALGPAHVTVRPFERGTLKGGDVVQDFAEFCGIGLAAPRGAGSSNSSLSVSALKLIFQFNQTGILKSGDMVLRQARTSLISQIARAYAGAPKIEPARFGALAVHDDLDWLRQTCGIDFARPDGPGTTSTDDLALWLNDLSDVDPAPLQALLAKYGLTGRYGKMPEQLCRLFYHLIHLSQQAADTARPR